MIYWHWLILGGVFLIIEILSLTTFFLFFSVSAFMMALISGLFPHLNVTWQVFIAALLAVISCICFYFIYRKRQNHSKEHNINDRLAQYIGLTVTLLENPKNGISKVKIGDTLWRIKVPSHCKMNDQVKIRGYESSTFIAD